MKETLVCHWIWKKSKDHTTNILRIPIRIPKDIQLPKGNYLIKIYQLIVEE